MEQYLQAILSLVSIIFTKLMAVPYIFHPTRLGEQNWLIVLLVVILINRLCMKTLIYLTGCTETVTENQIVTYIKKYFTKKEQTEQEADPKKKYT